MRSIRNDAKVTRARREPHDVDDFFDREAIRGNVPIRRQLEQIERVPIIRQTSPMDAVPDIEEPPPLIDYGDSSDLEN